MEVGNTFTAENYVYQAITQLYRVPSRFIVYILGELVTSFNHQIVDLIEDKNKYRTKLTEFEHKGRPSKNETEQYTRDSRTYNDIVEHHKELVNFLIIINRVLKMKKYDNNDDVYIVPNYNNPSIDVIEYVGEHCGIDLNAIHTYLCDESIVPETKVTSPKSWKAADKEFFRRGLGGTADRDFDLSNVDESGPDGLEGVERGDGNVPDYDDELGPADWTRYKNPEDGGTYDGPRHEWAWK
jgi:hypothetical protein